MKTNLKIALSIAIVAVSTFVLYKMTAKKTANEEEIAGIPKKGKILKVIKDSENGLIPSRVILDKKLEEITGTNKAYTV